MSRTLAALGALALSIAACHSRSPEYVPRADRRMTFTAVGDTVWYHEQTWVRTGIVSPDGDSMNVSADEDEVFQVVRFTPDSLVAWFDVIRIRTTRDGRVVPVDMRHFVRQPFVLQHDGGRYRVIGQPQAPGEEASVRELARHLDELFMTVPAAPLTAGLVWVDTLQAESLEPSARVERNTVTRYQVTGDTVVHDIASKVIRYESAITSIAASRADSSRTVLNGTETGVIVYSPARELIISRHRNGELEGEMVMVAGEQSAHLPHYHHYETTVDLLPPAAPREEVPDTAGPVVREQ